MGSESTSPRDVKGLVLNLSTAVAVIVVAVTMTWRVGEIRQEFVNTLAANREEFTVTTAATTEALSAIVDRLKKLEMTTNGHARELAEVQRELGRQGATLESLQRQIDQLRGN